jgi:hypothetical protein
MMKILISTFLSIFLAFNLVGQQETPRSTQWFWTATVGSQFNANPIQNGSFFSGYDPDFNIAAQVGVGRLKKLNDRWSIGQEARLRLNLTHVSYTLALNNFSSSSNPVTQVSKIRNANWQFQTEIPIYFKYQFNENWSMTSGIYAAATVLNAQRSNYNFPSDSPTQLFPQNESDWLTRFSGGVELGGLYNLTDRLSLRLTVQQGIFSAPFPRALTRASDRAAFASFQPTVTVGGNWTFIQ